MTSKLGTAVVLAYLAVAAFATAYVVPSIEYPAAKGALAQSELQFLKYALGVDGIVAFTNIPGLSEARKDCLVSVATCYEAGLLRKDKTLNVVLADGTTRVTLATDQATNAQVEDFGCPGLGAKMRTMQAIVDAASRVFAKAMDDTVLVKEQQPLFMAFDNPSLTSYQDFSAVVEHGAHLDHFHVYEKPAKEDDDHDQGEALERHTDQGLFVAIVPSISVKNGVPVMVNDGFEIELPSPRGLSRIMIPNNGDAVLFMLGDGMSNWIHSHAVQPLRVVPHRLVMQQSGVARAWFGRMFFPPKDAFLHKQRTTFDKLRMESVAKGAHNIDYAGCSNKRHALRDLTESACGTDEIWCWMGCRTTADLECSGNQTIQCVDGRDGQIWTNEAEHCFDCTATCYGTPASNSDGTPTAAPVSSTSAFCNTKAYPTNMYMDGFNGLGPEVPCLIFLFKSWVLDTEVKFAFGSLGAFFVGFVIEYIILLRRETKRAKTRRSSNCLRVLPDTNRSKTQSCVLITLYGIQLVLAYFAMLLAMTFSAVIFAMVMLGLTIGHFTFNSDTPAGGNEACCAANDDEEYAVGGKAVEPKIGDCCGGGTDGRSSPINAGSSDSPEPVTREPGRIPTQV